MPNGARVSGWRAVITSVQTISEIAVNESQDFTFSMSSRRIFSWSYFSGKNLRSIQVLNCLRYLRLKLPVTSKKM